MPRHNPKNELYCTTRLDSCVMLYTSWQLCYMIHLWTPVLCATLLDSCVTCYTCDSCVMFYTSWQLCYMLQLWRLCYVLHLGTDVLHATLLDSCVTCYHFLTPVLHATLVTVIMHVMLLSLTSKSVDDISKWNCDKSSNFYKKIGDNGPYFATYRSFLWHCLGQMWFVTNRPVFWVSACVYLPLPGEKFKPSECMCECMWTCHCPVRSLIRREVHMTQAIDLDCEANRTSTPRLHRYGNRSL